MEVFGLLYVSCSLIAKGIAEIFSIHADSKSKDRTDNGEFFLDHKGREYNSKTLHPQVTGIEVMDKKHYGQYFIQDLVTYKKVYPNEEKEYESIEYQMKHPKPGRTTIRTHEWLAPDSTTHIVGGTVYQDIETGEKYFIRAAGNVQVYVDLYGNLIRPTDFQYDKPKIIMKERPWEYNGNYNIALQKIKDDFEYFKKSWNTNCPLYRNEWQMKKIIDYPGNSMYKYLDKFQY